MNIRIKLIELEHVKGELMEIGYTEKEAIQMIQAVALCQLSECAEVKREIPNNTLLDSVPERNVKNDEDCSQGDRELLIQKKKLLLRKRELLIQRKKFLLIKQLQDELEESGYEREEALSIIQTAAITRLADCIGENYHGRSVLNIHGSIATYEQ